MDRPNLDVETRAFVDADRSSRATRAIGVEYSTCAADRRAGSRGEVILCGGAINSPQVLQLSGIGNAKELEALGVTSSTTCPASARTCRTTSRCTSSTAASSPSRSRRRCNYTNRPWFGLKWLLRAAGPGATNHFEGGGFVR